MHAPMQVTFLYEFKTHENISHRGPHLANKTTIMLVTAQMYILFPVTQFVMGSKKKKQQQNQQTQNLTKIHLMLALLLYKCTSILSKENTKGEKNYAIYLFQYTLP